MYVCMYVHMHLLALFAQWVARRQQVFKLNAVLSSLKDSWGVTLCIFNFSIEWRKWSVSRPGLFTPSFVKCLLSELEPYVLWPIQYWLSTSRLSFLLNVLLISWVLIWFRQQQQLNVAYNKIYNATFCVIFSSRLLRPPCKVQEYCSRLHLPTAFLHP